MVGWPLLLALGVFGAGCGGSRGGIGVLPSPEAAAVEEEFDPDSLVEEQWLIEPVGPEAVPQRPSRPPDRDHSGLLYRVQIAALSDSGAARRRRDEVALAFEEEIRVAVERGLHVVRSPDYSSRQQALDFKDRLRAAGLNAGDAFILVLNSNLSGGSLQRATSARQGDHAEHLSGWCLLIGQFLTNEEADQLKEKAILRLQRRDVEVVFEAPWYKVEVGFFQQRAEAQESSESLARRGFSNTLKKVRGEFADVNDGE